MRKNKSTLSQQYFDERYKESVAVSGSGISEENQKKNTQILKALKQEHYENVLEIGCSDGVLTELLAERSTKLLAIDISELAVEAAKKMLADQKNVTIKKASIPDSFPVGNYDLIIINEVGYYLSLRDLVETKNTLKNNLNSGGELLLAHSTDFEEDNPMSGNQVHEVFLRDEVFTLINSINTDGFRLDIFKKK